MRASKSRVKSGVACRSSIPAFSSIEALHQETHPEGSAEPGLFCLQITADIRMISQG
jgi:hypothetical protein